MKSALHYSSMILGIPIGFMAIRLLGDDPSSRIAAAFGILMIAVPCAVVGYLLNWLALRNVDPDQGIAEVAPWTNLVWWIFPPFGIIAGVVTQCLAQRSNTNEVRFGLLGILGVLLSIVNMGIGARDNVAAQRAAKYGTTQTVYANAQNTVPVAR